MRIYPSLNDIFRVGSLWSLPGLFALVLAGQATAQTVTTLHNFAGVADGAYPQSGLIMSGNTLYGTTFDGGNYDRGTVFALSVDGTAFKKLLDSGQTGVSGNHPNGLAMSGSTLYASTSGAAAGGMGGATVFAINTDGTGFTNLHVLIPSSEGWYALGDLVLAGNTLYGTTSEQGPYNNGTVFGVNTDGSGFTTSYSFPNNSDGITPFAGLVVSGNTLYGTAYGGGDFGYGTVFKVNTDGTGFTVLKQFGSITNDAGFPATALSLSGDTLYGTTLGGGVGGFSGTVFKVNTDGSGYTILHNFSANSDGGHPDGPLVQSGNTLYGTAGGGGSGGSGTIFKMNTDGSGFATLHNFAALSPNNRNSDGASPGGRMILSGNTLYGTTGGGGSLGYGTVFSLTLPGPELTMVPSGTNVVLSWPSDATGFSLQSATTLANGGDWQDSTVTPTQTNGQNVVTVSAAGSAGFFRLRQ